MVYAELGIDSKEVKFINAGHFPPILIKKENITQLKKDAPALGLVYDSEFNEQFISLDKDDFMIIYSDGLTEAQNETGDFFGDERFIELLKNSTLKSSQQLGETILSAIDTFIGKTPAHDDLTIAIIKRTI